MLPNSDWMQNWRVMNMPSGDIKDWHHRESARIAPTKPLLWRSMNFFQELKRRNVFRVGAAYAVVAWLVLQIADLVLDNISAPTWVMQVLMLIVAVGFPLALLFAWAFELTPTGLKLDAEVDRSQSIAPQTGKRLDRMIIGLLVVIVVVMAVERVWFAGSSDDDKVNEVTTEAVVDKSIAVLPFVDLSQAQDQSWFAKGLAEEILNALMRTPDLLVASRTSAFKYIDSDLDIRDIAAELSVAHVVEGSVRRSGDSVRVTAQLIRAADGFHLWSQNYDREISDVIAIQEDLAVSIARALETSMDPAALQAMMAAGTRSVEAYERYLNGLALDYEYNERGDLSYLRAAFEEFEKARALDPKFAAAHAEAARFWERQLLVTSAIETAPNEVMRWQYESELAAIRLEYRKQMQLLRRVLEKRPNYVNGWRSLTDLAVITADFDAGSEGVEHLQAIYAEQPDPGVVSDIMMALHRMERYAEAAEYASRATQDFPGSVGVAYQAHRALLWAGEIEAAAALMPVLAEDLPESAAVASVRQACAEGRRSDAERIAADFLSTLESPELDSVTWHLHMLLGRVDAANEVIRRSSSPNVLYSRAAWLFYRQFDPAPFPELVALLEREGVERKPILQVPFACS